MSANSSEGSPSPSLVAPNAPKFGTLVPNRIFVGGISANTTEAELHALFSSYGNVKATKIIADRAGISKGYGFVTFETEEEARRIQKEADNIILKDRKLNIAPAIKKQPFTRVYDEAPHTGPTAQDPTQVVPNGTILYHNGIPYTYHNGMAFFTTPDSLYQLPQPQTAYPVIYPQPIYVPQQYPYQNPVASQWPTGPWRWSSPNSSLPAQYVYTAVPAAPAATAAAASTAAGTSEIYHYATSVPSSVQTPTHSSSSGVPQMSYSAASPPELTDTAVVEAVHEGSKYPKRANSGGSGGSGYGGGTHKTYTPTSGVRAVRCGLSVLSGAGDVVPSRGLKQLQGHPSHLIPKTVNGVTVMAYPTPIIVATAAALPQQLKDHSPGDHEIISLASMTEVGMMGQPPGTLTPPSTPLTPMSLDAASMGTEDVAQKFQALNM